MTRPLGQALTLHPNSKDWPMKNYQTELRIGAFSQLMQVTVKTLRNYELKGLLLPHRVDEWTGYRYYNIHQLHRLTAISQMQGHGFSLEEIKDLLEEGTQTPSLAQLDEKINQTQQQLEALTLRHQRLLQWRDARKQLKQMEEITIQSLPAIIVASHREVIPNYDALGPLCCQQIGPAMLAAGCRCTEPGYCFTIDHNQEYKRENIDIEYCEQIEELRPDTDFLQFKQLPAIPKALCMKHVGPYERFSESFTRAVAYLEEQGYRIAGNPRFCYIDGAWNQEDPEKWVSLIQIPIE